MTSLNSIAAYTDGDIDTNLSDNPTLGEIVHSRYSRRQTMFGGATAVATAVFGGALVSACGGGDNEAPLTVVTTVSAASSGKMVALSSMVSGGTASAQSFEQVSGPPVTLINGNTPSASFLAPSVTADTQIVFRATAQGSGGSTTSINVPVTIAPAKLDFTAVPKSLADVVAVPAGYSVTVLYRLGDPINATAPAFANDGTDTNFGQRAGDHHDGMSYFGLAATGAAPDTASSTRAMLVLNHENITQRYLHPNGPTTVAGARPEAEALKEMECHGVSAIEIARSAGTWAYVPGSTLNRRVTPLTPTVFNGPAAGNAQLRTRFSPTGVAGRGTINNCANGTSPWSTYLTNEENWAGYFRRDTGDVALRGGATAKVNVSLNRYGVREGAAGNYGWSTVTPADPTSTIYSRWNTTSQAGQPADGTGDFRNESFQFGWVVEIDPYDPTKAPRKRTALGRMNHEGCWPGRTVAGVKPAFYMGDDAQNEYLYKFVSAAPWAAADATAADRLATGDKYLDAGTLYVARFNADGSGDWLPLTFGTGGLTAASTVYPFADQADVLINARLAGDVLGATKMDRPEWTAVNPATGEMYLTLTNNSSRTLAGTDPANPRYYNDPKGATAQRGNPNGHIIRLRETGDTTEAVAFRWDIYAFGSGSDLDAANINLSGLDATNDFSSPDGLWFSRASNAAGLVTPLLWIETDDGAYTDQTNCMLLAAMPGSVGDGGAKTITNTDAAGVTRTQATLQGRNPGTQLRRFLVGPKECEITGIDTTPDGRSVFVNIQHPGENGSPTAITSNWPANQGGTAAPTARPRSATIVITKNDGGVVGL